MIKRLILSISVILACSLGARAQMSDSQVVDYAKTQMATGKDAKQVGKELLARGVSMQQLERLKSQYENQEPEATAATSTIERNRVTNGETDPDNSGNAGSTAGSRRIFGHDIFRSQNLSFEPSMNIATPVNYLLGPGDEVVLDIYGASQYNGSFKVAPDGSITIPNEGPVSVAGLTVAQAQARVAKTIGAHYQDSSIKLSVGQTRTILVNVLGEVKTPGTYTLSAFSTVFNALYLAGGITDIGTLREIKVSRNGRIISKVDVYEYIMNGKLSGNVTLQDNDAIIVGPYQSLVRIEGKIKRPMYYEMKKSESLQSLLQYAGGFTGDAYKEKVRIERRSEDGLTVHNVDEWDFNSFRTEDGDVAVVGTIIERFKNTVSIEGAVFRPGQYKLGGAVNSVKTLVEQSGGLVEQAVLTRAVLHRMKADRTLQTMTINLAGIMDGTQPDVVLENEDRLIISSNEAILSRHTMSIYGEVVHPGQYHYSDGETIEDLITEAGGLTESASVLNVEVARRIMSSEDNPDGTKMAKIYSMSLQNGLAIEGSTDFKLRPYDIVTIHRSPDYREQLMVFVAGEVNYSGSYILANKEERVTDLIKRAGGLNKSAYIDGVRLIRRRTSQELDMLYRKLELATNAADTANIRAQMNKHAYTVGIDLNKAIKNPGGPSDIILQEGDSIYVPRLNNVVKIDGEVALPNTVAYVEGKSASYYLDRAGGISKNGKKSLAYIVYPNGQASKLRKGKVLPGCSIFVPKKPEKKSDAQTTSLIIAAVSALSTIAAVLITALK